MHHLYEKKFYSSLITGVGVTFCWKPDCLSVFGTGGYWHIFYWSVLLYLRAKRCHNGAFVHTVYSTVHTEKKTNWETINKRNANDSIIESNELLNFCFFGKWMNFYIKWQWWQYSTKSCFLQILLSIMILSYREALPTGS